MLSPYVIVAVQSTLVLSHGYVIHALLRRRDELSPAAARMSRSAVQAR